MILLQMVLQMNRVVTQREASLPEKKSERPSTLRSKGSCHWKRSARNSAIPKIILLRYSAMNMASLPTATLRRRKSRLPSSTYAIPVLQLTRSPSTSPMPTGIIFQLFQKAHGLCAGGISEKAWIFIGIMHNVTVHKSIERPGAAAKQFAAAPPFIFCSTSTHTENSCCAKRTLAMASFP